MSANFAACQDYFVCKCRFSDCSVSGLFTDVRYVNNGISGEIVFTASVVLDAVGKQDHYDLSG